MVPPSAAPCLGNHDAPASTEVCAGHAFAARVPEVVLRRCVLLVAAVRVTGWAQRVLPAPWPVSSGLWPLVLVVAAVVRLTSPCFLSPSAARVAPSTVAV